MIPMYSGAGNTFVVIDNRGSSFPYDDRQRIQEICRDVDGALFLENGETHPYRLRIHNKDGSHAHMCGNGVRCFVKYLEDQGLIKGKLHLETDAGPLQATIEGNEVTVTMPQPKNLQLGDHVHLINTGVPHAVLLYDAIPEEIAPLGKKLREELDANVDFVRKIDERTLEVRTYERGVEAETLACGTGATASALIASKVWGLDSPLTVEVRSGEKLVITFDPQFSKISMRGPVTGPLPKYSRVE